MLTNHYEQAFDELLLKKERQHRARLISILDTYQQELIALGVLKDDGFESVRELLQQVAEGTELNFQTEFDFRAAVEAEEDKALKLQLTMEGSALSQEFGNPEDSKTHRMQMLLADRYHKKLPINKEIWAQTFLEVFDAEDFKFPLVRLLVFRFLHPQWDSVLYVHIEKPVKK